MWSHWKKEGYNPSPLLRGVQIFLLILIIVGVVFLFTQNFWVPKLVGHILKSEINNSIPPKPDEIVVQSNSGVEGVVTIGPTCPVVRYPDDGTCADRPFETTLEIVSSLPGKGGGILVHSDSNGHFSQKLAPGTYTIKSQIEGIMPSMSPVGFEVITQKYTTLNLQFDSGIR